MEWKIFDTRSIDTLGVQLEQISAVIASSIDLTEQPAVDDSRLQTLLLLALDILSRSQKIVEETQMFFLTEEEFLIRPTKPD